MTKPDFIVSRRFPGGPYDLVRSKRDAHQMTMAWNNGLTTFDRDVGFGLFYYTSGKDPYDWQEVTARDLLDIVDVASFADPSAPHHGAQYQRAFQAIERLYNVSLPFRRTDVVKGKRRHHFGVIRFLQGFGLVYFDQRGNEIDLDNPAHGFPVIDIRERYEDEDEKTRRKRAGDSWGSVLAIPQVDAEGNIVSYPSGRPAIVPPPAYRFRWASDIADDLADSRKGGKGSGWIKVSTDIFRVKKTLRDKNQKTAAALLNLLISDLWANPPDRIVTEKPAKDIFVLLGFPEPGSRGRLNLHRQDGRWSENVERVASAVRALKAEGVLMDESDETPRVDTNADRRKAPYYRWRRPEAWVTGGTLAVVERVAELREQAQAVPRVAKQDHPTGHDVRAAREAAGLTVRQFAGRFGASAATWSKYERGISLRFPKEASRRAVADFIRDHVPGFTDIETGDGQTELFQDGTAE